MEQGKQLEIRKLSYICYELLVGITLKLTLSLSLSFSMWDDNTSENLIQLSNLRYKRK